MTWESLSARVDLAARRTRRWDLLVIGALALYGIGVDPESGAGGLPCLWKWATGSNCLGCGLSRAGALLLRGRWADAAAMNWLIFPVLMLTLVVLIRAFFTLTVGGFGYGRTRRS